MEHSRGAGEGWAGKSGTGGGASHVVSRRWATRDLTNEDCCEGGGEWRSGSDGKRQAACPEFAEVAGKTGIR